MSHTIKHAYYVLLSLSIVLAGLIFFATPSFGDVVFPESITAEGCLDVQGFESPVPGCCWSGGIGTSVQGTTNCTVVACPNSACPWDPDNIFNIGEVIPTTIEPGAGKERLSSDAPSLFYDYEKDMGLIDFSSGDSIKVNIVTTQKTPSLPSTKLGRAFDNVFGQIKHFYSNLIRGKFKEAVSSQFKSLEEGGQDFPDDDDDDVIGRRRFYYDRVYVGDDCTARRLHYTESTGGYVVTASFPCGDEPWLIVPGEEGQFPADEIYAEGTIDNSVDIPSENARAGQHRYRTIQNEDGCFAQRITLSETGWVITAQYPFEDHPWYFANLSPCGGFVGEEPEVVSPITDKELYCEIDSTLSFDAQRSKIQSCIDASGLSEKEKNAVLEAFNAQN